MGYDDRKLKLGREIERAYLSVEMAVPLRPPAMLLLAHTLWIFPVQIIVKEKENEGKNESEGEKGWDETRGNDNTAMIMSTRK